MNKITNEIPKQEWKQFFDDLSREKLDWQTKIEVMNDETGAQILTEGLPLGGLTFDDKDGQERIEFIVGSGTENHQTHNISEPEKVYFRRADDRQVGTVEIEDAGGTKTLVHIIQPMPVLVQYVETETVITTLLGLSLFERI